MRTLHIDLAAEWRGGQEQVLLLLRGLRRCGHTVELVALGGAPLATRAAAEGFTVHSAMHWRAPTLARLHAALTVRRLLGGKPFDVVHAHEAHGLTAAWLARAHRRSRLVAARRVAFPLNSPGRYAAAQHVIAVSRSVGDVATAAGVEHVSVVHDGVEVPPPATGEERQRARKNWGAEADTILLGCVGFLSEEKGHAKLLAAMPKIREKHPNCRLLLAGEGPLSYALEDLAHVLGLGESAQFVGFVENLPEFYDALDIFVFPSLSEGLGTALLLAMAHGLPVVASARGGIPEAVKHGENGLLVRDPEPELLAGAVASLLGDPARARQLGAAGRRTVVQHFSAEQMVDNTIAVYEQVCRETPRS
ncbi:MAG TPA: glycosyltransferase family 4 protein [Candidatus Xenobia bacterium]|nr:glycosyltransferase family 4 protein [Candidatus Xenobia bacterium]